MNTHQNIPAYSARRSSPPAYRGPFSLGLSRLPHPGSRRGLTSRRISLICGVLAVVIGAITTGWLLSLPAPTFPRTTRSFSTGYGLRIDRVSFIGGMGLLASAGFSLAGLWFWPFRRRVSIPPREESLAAYDHVTGLPTFRLFTVLLNQALTRASQLERRVGVLVAELHQYYPLPTSLTTPNLSLIVRVQAARIKSAVSPHQTVARIGERRFAILIEESATSDQIEASAQSIYRTMSLPLMIEGQEVFLVCQIGGAWLSPSASSGAALLEQAVQALGAATAEQPIRFADSGDQSPAGAAPSANQSAMESLLR